ncbi:MAG: hypothetical protein HZA15_00405 [Nitrospirae bacterium]|nr:hypothetical protein [Nitrospirota bacterium]
MRWLCLMLLFPVFAFAGEDCSLINGTCKDVCAAHEEAAKGAFLDCTDKQECCVKKEGFRSGDKKSPAEDKDYNQKSKTEK